MKSKVTIKARYLKVGDRYNTGQSIQEVTEIIKISDKTIEHRTKRISPNPYDGNFFMRPHLDTELEMVNYLP